MLSAARRVGMTITAYYAMVDGKVVGDEVIRDIGARHGKNEAQVVLRWLIQQARVLSYPDAHRYRLGVNYELLPVNRAHATEARTYHRDGAMRFDDNGGGSPNYEPDSFGGPVGDPNLPGHETHAHLHLHRWCQWISRYHPAGVYDGEEGKRWDYTASLPPFLCQEVLLPHLQQGGRAVWQRYPPEEWPLARAVSRVKWYRLNKGLLK